MVYLEFASLTSFAEELKSRGLKEARIQSYYQVAPDQQFGSLASLRIVVSAYDKMILKAMELIGVLPTSDQKGLKELFEATKKREAEIIKLLKAEKIKSKAGEYKE